MVVKPCISHSRDDGEAQPDVFLASALGQPSSFDRAIEPGLHVRPILRGQLVSALLAVLERSIRINDPKSPNHHCVAWGRVVSGSGFDYANDGVEETDDIRPRERSVD